MEAEAAAEADYTLTSVFRMANSIYRNRVLKNLCKCLVYFKT